MQSRSSFVLFVGLLSIFAVGCGEPEPFDHTQVQELYIEAMRAKAAGDEAKCVDSLTQVLEAEPMEDAYFHRGWIFAKQGSFDKANADVATGLEMVPEHPNLLWLAGELKEPADKRNFEMTPSSNK